MKKFLLLSVIIASIVIPARAARLENAREGLKKTLVQIAIFDVVYMILITQVWGRL